MLKAIQILTMLCFVHGISCAITITGQLGSSTVATLIPPDTTTSFSVTDGVFTLQVTSMNVFLGGCISPSIDGSSTGIWWGPCVYTPTGSGITPSAFFGDFGWRLTGPGTFLSLLGNPGTTLSLDFSYLGSPVTLQPASTAFANFWYTTSSNVPVNVRGLVEVRTNGNCVWCPGSFTGSGLTSGTQGTPNGGAGFGNLILTFTGETVPEPSTGALVLAVVGLLATRMRKR